MRIEELSIGDFLFFTDGDCAVRVEEIYNDAQLLISDGDSISEPVHLTHLHPIPLTPEILEKNGFKREQYTIDIADNQEIEYDGYRHILCQDGVQYDIILGDSCGGYFDLEIESSHRDEAGERILISSKLSLDYVEFVHQLQKAMRLAGIEKEIEL